MLAMTRHPGNHRSIIKTQHELGRQLNGPLAALNKPHEMAASFAPQRHEIDNSCCAAVCLDLGRQNQRPRQVASANPGICRGGAEAPMPIVVIAQERGEHRAGIKARPAQPIDRTVPADQRGRLAIANERVILNALPHCAGLLKVQLQNGRSSRSFRKPTSPAVPRKRSDPIPAPTNLRAVIYITWMSTFFTIGHSTRPLAVFADLLQAAKAELVADVRTFPRSRSISQFNQVSLSLAFMSFQI